MRKVVTAAQMREIDRLTTEKYAIPSILLMENAANAVAGVVAEELGGSVAGKSVLVLCGPGNNGGDGAALARILSLAGASVEAVLFARIDDLSGDARTNFEILRGNETANGEMIDGPFCDIYEVGSKESWDGFAIHQRQFEVVVDAIFGTGLRRPVEGWLSQVFNEINFFKDAGEQWCVSVDIPSGINADTGEKMSTAVQADATVAFTSPKAGNILPGAAEFNGELVIADIGSPWELVEETDSQLYLAEADDVREWLEDSEFSSSSYKNKRGHALIVAGSKNYSGAAVLCGDAAIRSGCGLATIATSESSRLGIIGRVSPEVMVRGLSETEGGSIAEGAVDELREFSKNVDVIAIGSGISSNEETARFVRRLVAERTMPVVIDADGLSALSPWSTRGSDDLPVVLTPHQGEFRKMLGLEQEAFDKVIRDRVGAVRSFATEHGVFLVLKGERVMVGHPDGRVIVNPTGNAGLGKAGNGDTLTGIVAGFLAQAVKMEIDIFETLIAAVYVAGMAGDIAAEKIGKRAMTASDVRNCLVEVFAELEQ
jgi:ADP-dependent NAD(P)H-hydrate dehydratase / NAD(P)H-hydrate epimerase